MSCCAVEFGDGDLLLFLAILGKAWDGEQEQTESANRLFESNHCEFPSKTLFVCLWAILEPRAICLGTNNFVHVQSKNVEISTIVGGGDTV